MLQFIPHRLTLLIALCLFAVSNTHAQHQLLRQVLDTKTDSWIQVTCLFSQLPSYGYAPIRVEIRNGTQTDFQVNLDFDSSDLGSYRAETGSRVNSSFQGSCAAGQRETYDFIVPVTTVFTTGSYNSGSELSMKLRCSGYPSSSASMSTDTESTWPAIIASNAVYVPNASTISSHISSSSSSSSSGTPEFGGSFDVKNMPTDWRAYMGQEIVMLTSNDWSQLDPGARTAILDWNRLGGRLLIYTTSTSDTFASMQIDSDQTATANTKQIYRSMGSVTLTPFPSSGRLDAKKTHHLLMTGSFPDPSKAKKLSPTTAQTSYHGILYGYSGKWPLVETLGKKNFNTTLFILILFFFGVLIGPINLFVFARGGRRHKLFITTPIIALGTSLLLIIVILFQDGFGGRGHRVSLMEISPQDNKAFIIQEQAARTGVLLGSSFETSEPSMMTPVALALSRWARVVTDGQAPASYKANHGDEGLKLSGDWFQSRSVHGHLLKTVRPTRGRLELSPQAGAPNLSSTFDYHLDTIYYHAHDGSWWKTEALEKGNSTTLTPVSKTEFKLWIEQQEGLFSLENAKIITELSSQPNRFFTLTEAAQATETSPSIKWLSTKTLITGKLGK